MERLLVQILVVVASIQMRFLKAEVEMVSMSTAFEHGLAGPKSKADVYYCELAVNT